jgi:methyl-accepting chemotaxis protein
VKWYLNLKTSAKLISAFLAMALILAALGIYSIQNLSGMNANTREMYSNNLVSVRDLSAGQIDYEKSKVRLRDIALESTKEEKDALVQQIADLHKDLTAKMDSYRNTPLTKPEQEQLAIFDSNYPTYLKLFDQAQQMAYAEDPGFVKFKDGQLTDTENKIRDSFVNLIAMNVKFAEGTNTKSLDDYSRARTATIIVVVIVCLLSVIMGYAIAQAIARPLQKMVALTARIASGDLRETANFSSKDEVGQLADSMNHMVRNLCGMIGGIAQTSQGVAAASQQISSSTEEIASSSTTQAQSATSITELFKELSTAINAVARSAEEAAELSDATLQTAREGGKVVEASAQGMQQVSKAMSRLEEDSNKIGNIIEVIDDIADQTNLLALNAAIEAARAGDQGRGFAVVADEVRKLAERSSEATKEISAIIKNMQENTKQSVSAVLDSVAQSAQTGESFGKIVRMVGDSTHKVNEIAAACEQEAAQASDVMISVESIAAASEEAAAASEETATTCQSLAQLAGELDASIAVFQLK